MRIAREEIFGPVAAVICVKDYEEALTTANETPFGLSAGIATTNLKYASHFKRNSQASMVMVITDGRRRLSRAVRRQQGLELWAARAGPLCGGVLHDGQDRLRLPRQSVTIGLIPHRCVSGLRKDFGQNSRAEDCG